MGKAKQILYEIGKVFSVAVELCMAIPEDLQARAGVGDKVFQTKQSIEAEGQMLPCGAQIMTLDQQKANPGKFLLVTEGFARMAIAAELGRPLDVLIHKPFTDLQIFERNVAANGPKSNLSPLDINAIIHRGLKLGLSDADMMKRLAFVAGRGKAELGKMRYAQYKAYSDLPGEIQSMGHEGLIGLDAILHMTNAKRTAEQNEAVVAQALDRRKREAKEQYDRDLIYIKREKDLKLAAAMKGELGPEPVYIKRERVKGAVSKSEPLTTAEVKAAEADLDLAGKNKHKAADVAGTPLTTEELIHVAGQLRARDGVMIEVGNLLEALVLRKISEAEYCAGLEAIFKNGHGEAKRVRRELVSKIAKNGPTVKSTEMVGV